MACFSHLLLIGQYGRDLPGWLKLLVVAGILGGAYNAYHHEEKKKKARVREKKETEGRRAAPFPSLGPALHAGTGAGPCFRARRWVVRVLPFARS